jgi:phenylpropionate dioxygenase-like ring-hydroxylating dioxygenase large terminal subunit
MLSEGDNNTLTQVGPGTPVGNLMRRYWIPAALSTELREDGDPMRLMLLGEKLIAFRATDGKVGVMDHRCSHRCASLFYGRNEEGGIRCIYHGWKFDAEGNCVDMPNVPAHQDFKHRVHAKAYKTAERNGIVWVYMGDQNDIPSLPRIESLLLPPDGMEFNFAQRVCNWLQALEGDIDTSHVDFLHGGARTERAYAPDDPRRWGAINRSPEYEVKETGWGAMYGANRPGGPGQTYWRVAQFLFPFWTITPSGPFGDHMYARAWVPMDDTHTMSMRVLIRANRPPSAGTELNLDKVQPNSTDWYGRWRPETTAENDYLIDRQRQRAGSFSGLPGITPEDQAVTESMGDIIDRRLEHLAPSDRMIAVTRRTLLATAEALAKGEMKPANDGALYAGVNGGYFLAPDDLGLRDAYEHASIAAGKRHAPVG